MCEIGIVGAGPYGLSLGAHLHSERANFRIFGVPMQSWTSRMAMGMHLKSEGFASTLYDRAGEFSFSSYCRANDIPYADTGLPVSLKDFSEYGLEFQRRYVPVIEPKQAARIKRHQAGFEIQFDDGEVGVFRRVVLAVGITHFAYLPPQMAGLPETVLSHSSAHHDMSRFKGKAVAVVGGGSSATDCAAALVAAGAQVRVLTRGPRLKFHAPPKAGSRSLIESMRWPLTSIGSGWKNVFCTQMPLAFHALPQKVRHEVTRRHLGPVSCWFTRDIVEQHTEVMTSTEVRGVATRGQRAILTLRQNGQDSSLEVDHVIAATGYRVNLDRLGFLDPGLRAQIRSSENTPVLSRFFESSVPGLYLVGVASANSFGPLVRFACGAEFTAGRLANHLLQKARPASQPTILSGHVPARTTEQSAAAGDAY
ncbi:NAD(P)-binding domain-containing protein [Lichenifustis flavocetrariae]|uniref:Lysine N(6)-hydroxylase/L-ornithine N(5)-oxygenase family protein n=1 Tax=Lichenifustis flavocetrariae TaxID=2949735 RepID=A0AA42CIZ5_9HYPH|nr:NAD(P)-binding domain-containing protein [Lichenifustis flavocetrariae]MCW6509048.1 lysine N(6)-hydroxylase/L-ornithine N(5)-oxygenase family protein [Lichenifustis flavocetrariae]